MALIDWLKGIAVKTEESIPLDICIGEITSKIFYKQLAIQTSVNLIANTISMGEFITYEKGKKARRNNYYLLNIQPNQNKNSSKFWRDVVSKLVYDNECLIIMQDNNLYVADDFNILRFAFKENIYKDIVIEGYGIKNIYKESQVLYLEWHDKKIKKIIDGLYSDYGKLIELSKKGFIGSKSRKGILNIPTSYPETEKHQDALKKLLDERFKKFFDSEGDAVLPLANGLGYEEVGKDKTSNKSTESGREIRGFVDDIFDFIAIAFQIPPSLLKGNVQDTNNAMNNFLTFCINPISKLITDEINRKMYSKEQYLERCYVKLDTSKIKVVDLKDIANALDVLTRIGAYSVDDSLKTLGMEPLNTEWSKVRWMTKNYESITDRLEGDEKGGG